MRDKWQLFLKQYTLTNWETVLANLNTDNFFIDLTNYYGLLKISGSDAEKFLQGQLTCDVHEISSGSPQIGAYCTLKGRILTSLRCFYFQQAYYLRMPIDTLASTLTTLQKYAVFSKVTLENASNHLISIGFFHHKKSKLPATNNHLIMLPAILDEQHYEVYVKPEYAAKLIQPDEKLAPSKLWRLLTIRTGIATIYANTQDTFLPHRVNYQYINALNFTKGCYLGQEIIARMHYRGQLKHHMYHIELTSPILLMPGMTINNFTKKSIGQIVDVVSLTDNQYEALIVLAVEYANTTEVIIEQTKVTMKLLALPYSLEKENTA